jgi:hypothetical protein
MVPVMVRFGPQAVLQMKQVIAVLVDREKKEVVFAVATAAGTIAEALAAGGKAETPEFTLIAAGSVARREGGAVVVELR